MKHRPYDVAEIRARFPSLGNTLDDGTPIAIDYDSPLIGVYIGLATSV